MNRRTFLTSALALPAIARGQAPAGRSVVVLGAGLAGLSAAYQLDAAGYGVTILEARTRPGGRVYTLREPFSDGLYAETGAARIQDSHQFTLKYVKLFNLALDPFFPTDGARITYAGGQRVVVPPLQAVDLARLPLPFSDEERKLGLGRSLAKYLFSHLSELGDPTKPGWPNGVNVSSFETSIHDFVRKQGASEGMIRMIALGHDLAGMSALQLLRDAQTGASTKIWYKIRGGNDQLPKALAAKLSDRIRYGAAVVRLEQDENSARAVYLNAGTPVAISADYIVCAIPLPVMRRVEVPVLSSRKRQAIYELEYLPMARVFLQSRTRFWLARGESGWASTDHPIDVWDYTRDQPGKRGILGAYTSGRMALQLTYREPAERAAMVLNMMESVHPGIRENYEGSASHSWVTDPWSLGAAAEFKSGQLSAYYQTLRAPEGRIHFAGEHTSPWNSWMNGGLESGERAASEIIARR